MEGQRHRAGRERRRRKARPNRSAAPSEPILIAARRPDAPRVKTPGRSIAASARPRKASAPPPEAALSPSATVGAARNDASVEAGGESKARRAVRIIQSTKTLGELESLRSRLLQRLLEAEGPSAITKAADALAEQQMEVPEEQELQVQLLEHSDERRALAAVDAIGRLLAKQPPKKRPILERRLCRLEEEADDANLRASAGALRKALRGA